MKKYILYILSAMLLLLSCERRELTYDYQPTVAIVVNTDWSDMSTTPSGMSVYCYPEDGSDPIVVITNNISYATVDLPMGVYKILVFNQIPSDFGTLSFDGLDSYETAAIYSVPSSSTSSISKTGAETVRDPEEVAAATYLDLEVTEDAINESIYARTLSTKAEDLIYKNIYVTPKVVIKTTRVKIRISGIYNFYSADAQLYGMATGYNFSQEKSHTDMVTHSLQSWTSTTYEEDYREGEISINFTCFGLPGQTASSVVADYADWEGVIDVDILLVDQSTIISESIPLNDKITATSTDDTKADVDTETTMDVSVDIDISTGYGLDDDDDAVELPDVEPVGGSSSGFDATVDDWGTSEDFDVPV